MEGDGWDGYLKGILFYFGLVDNYPRGVRGNDAKTGPFVWPFATGKAKRDSDLPASSISWFFFPSFSSKSDDLFFCCCVVLISSPCSAERLVKQPK